MHKLRINLLWLQYEWAEKQQLNDKVIITSYSAMVRSDAVQLQPFLIWHYRSPGWSPGPRLLVSSPCFAPTGSSRTILCHIHSGSRPPSVRALAWLAERPLPLSAHSRFVASAPRCLDAGHGLYAISLYRAPLGIVGQPGGVFAIARELAAWEDPLFFPIVRLP
ncbi:hypothetical protein BX600DRAFT_167850 [Xylariales sp. PMI_506]|nr:hypothetical protein BX600DRAFT_167850 [Xylariales sp. PMI_506]